MTYKLWDKQSPIYDITADQAMINNPKYRDEDSYLFLRDDGSIYDLLALSMIPNPNNLSDPDEICQAYINSLTAPEPDSPDDITTLKAKVKALTELNQMLEECLVEMAEIVYA